MTRRTVHQRRSSTGGSVAQSLKPATYRCPFCDELLHAMSEHLVIVARRECRSASPHIECLLAARNAGTFRTYGERPDSN
jgi:hypothetical protein